MARGAPVDLRTESVELTMAMKVIDRAWVKFHARMYLEGRLGSIDTYSGFCCDDPQTSHHMSSLNHLRTFCLILPEAALQKWPEAAPLLSELALSGTSFYDELERISVSLAG